MIYPQTEKNEWASRYKIPQSCEPCHQCGSDIELEIPIALKGYRGLEAKPCKCCGHDSGIFRVVPVDSEKIELWETLIEIFNF